MQSNPDGTPTEFLDFAAIKAYLIRWEKELRSILGDYAIVQT